MSVRRGSEEASATIWRWQDDDRRVEARRRRIAGLWRGVVGAAVGGVALWLGHPRLAWVAWGLSGLTTGLALVSPLGSLTPGTPRNRYCENWLRLITTAVKR